MKSKFKKVLGIILILICLILFLSDVYTSKKIKRRETKKLENYYLEYNGIGNKEYNSLETSYIGILSIPKLKLERGLVSPSSSLNNVEYNIEIVDGSIMPEQENSRIILASHSGNSRVSYFKDLYKLELNDTVILDYLGKIYEYRVEDISLIEKTGTVNIENKSNILVLITCKRSTNMQIVVTCVLD